ncbi:hypothetical protein O181_009841 [Austropuccinia psidii MF-1]|uniref:Uncharacterized protein n=1 Tax=Austropuccinia psidii MF-1 TaxID=1389203 RepID=A0A9Q3GJU7_9BASI|nr:hypothetical protein [Austropuccinia psidii MF-1]
MIKTLEDMIRRFCSYGLGFKDSGGFTHDWCTLIPALELEYKISIHSSTGELHAVLEKDWNPRKHCDTLKKYLVDINLTDSFKYAKQRWDQSHKLPYFEVGDLVLVLKLNFHNIKGPKKLKYSFPGPFMITSLHSPKAVQLELTGELINKHSTFPEIITKTYSSSDQELFSLINIPPHEIAPL